MIAGMTRKDRATVTLDPELIVDIKSRVGERGVSRYLNEALRDKLRLEAMSTYLAERERERGPLPQALLREVASLMDHAHEPVGRERARLRLKERLGLPEPPTRLPEIAAKAREAGISLQCALGNRAMIEIDGDDVRIIDVDVPTDGSYGPR